MRFLLCVDDTDDLTKATSTGTIAELIGNEVVKLGGKIEKGITRHQLLLDDAIAYTSHNSSMCFVAEIEAQKLDQIKDAAARIIKAYAAAEADPGVCICCMNELKDPDSLIVFGLKAQKEVLTKGQAYKLAEKAGGIWLKEFGGSGIGVIGALAGVGLRLSGNDGTFRGKSGHVTDGPVTLTIGEMLQQLGAEAMLTIAGNDVDAERTVVMQEHAKLAYLNHKITVVVYENEVGDYVVCQKRQMYDGLNKLGDMVHDCPNFEYDNDYEECYTTMENNCYNCLYRRWGAKSFLCTQEN